MRFQGSSARCSVPVSWVGERAGLDYVTRFSFPYFDMPVVANGFQARERPDDKLPYQPKRTGSVDPVPVELKQEPEPSAPAPPDGVSEVEEIEPEFALTPDDDVQNLITRG
jgi:hypothetical protein